MTTNFRPSTAEQLRDAVAWAAASETALEIVGQGSKRGLGRPMQTGATLDLSAMSGITLYEPEELVLTAAAGTPMAEIAVALAAKRQMLAFEPGDWGPLFGGAAGAGTLGGTLAANLSGPRRIKSGAPRDHFLGVTAVSGRGEIFKSGGRVVKNVTGYDLCKLLAGSHGTLAAMSEVSVKVMPLPPETRTVVLSGQDAAAAIGALTKAMLSPHDPSAAAYLPAGIAERSAVDRLRTGAPATCLRVEGTPASVRARTEGLVRLLGGDAPSTILDADASALLWHEVRDVARLLPTPGRAIWRLSVPPSAGPKVMEAIAAAVAAEYYLDWAGGLAWLAVAPVGDAGAQAIRQAVAMAGGHATLIRAPASLRAAVPVFEPEPEALAHLTARVKEGFDPKRVLNPGRMYAGV